MFYFQHMSENGFATLCKSYHFGLSLLLFFCSNLVYLTCL